MSLPSESLQSQAYISTLATTSIPPPSSQRQSTEKTDATVSSTFESPAASSSAETQSSHTITDRTERTSSSASNTKEEATTEVLTELPQQDEHTTGTPLVSSPAEYATSDHYHTQTIVMVSEVSTQRSDMTLEESTMMKDTTASTLNAVSTNSPPEESYTSDVFISEGASTESIGSTVHLNTATFTDTGNAVLTMEYTTDQTFHTKETPSTLHTENVQTDIISHTVLAAQTATENVRTSQETLYDEVTTTGLKATDTVTDNVADEDGTSSIKSTQKESFTTIGMSIASQDGDGVSDPAAFTDPLTSPSEVARRSSTLSMGDEEVSTISYEGSTRGIYSTTSVVRGIGSTMDGQTQIDTASEKAALTTTGEDTQSTAKLQPGQEISETVVSTTPSLLETQTHLVTIEEVSSPATTSLTTDRDTEIGMSIQASTDVKTNDVYIGSTAPSTLPTQSGQSSHSAQAETTSASPGAIFTSDIVTSDTQQFESTMDNPTTQTLNSDKDTTSQILTMPGQTTVREQESSIKLNQQSTTSIVINGPQSTPSDDHATTGEGAGLGVTLDLGLGLGLGPVITSGVSDSQQTNTYSTPSYDTSELHTGPNTDMADTTGLPTDRVQSTGLVTEGVQVTGLTTVEGHTTELAAEAPETTEPATQLEQTTEPDTETVQTVKPTTEVLQTTGLTTEASETTGLAAEASETTVQAAESSTETLQTTEPSTETLQTTEPSTETLQTTEPSTETLQTTEPSTETLQTTEPSTETLKATEPTTEVVRTTDMAAQTTDSRERRSTAEPTLAASTERSSVITNYMTSELTEGGQSLVPLLGIVTGESIKHLWPFSVF